MSSKAPKTIDLKFSSIGEYKGESGEYEIFCEITGKSPFLERQRKALLRAIFQDLILNEITYCLVCDGKVQESFGPLKAAFAYRNQNLPKCSICFMKKI